MSTNVAIYNNYGRYEIEGSFDLSAAAAVLPITIGTDSVTCRGDNLSCAAGGTGTYTVTLKGTGNLQLVETIFADAAIRATTVAAALFARVSSVTQSTNGDIVITVLTTSAAGAAIATTAAITVGFQVVLRNIRVNNVL